MPSRRERAIERANSIEYGASHRMIRIGIKRGIHAYEAELAADLESEEMVERVALAIFASDQERRVDDAKFTWSEAAESTREFYLDDARAALKVVLEER